MTLATPLLLAIGARGLRLGLGTGEEPAAAEMNRSTSGNDVEKSPSVFSPATNAQQQTEAREAQRAEE